MKTPAIICVLLCFTVRCFSQIGFQRQAVAPSAGADSGWAATSAAYAAAAQAAAEQRARELTIQNAKATASRMAWLIHPLRVFDGRLYDLSAAAMEKYEHDFNPYYQTLHGHWFEVYSIKGKVLSVTSDGILVSGSRGFDDVCFVRNYPGLSSLADGDQVDDFGIPDGIYRYTAASGAGRSVPQFEYGRPMDRVRDHFETEEKYLPDGPQIVKYVSPEEQLAAQKKIEDDLKSAQAKKKAKADEAALKFTMEQADNGSPYYQFKLGVRYASGDGVDKDEAKARDYLSKSAAQGNKDAEAELAKLSGVTPTAITSK